MTYIHSMTVGDILRQDYDMTPANAHAYVHLVGINETNLIDIINNDKRVTRKTSALLANSLGIHSDDYFYWIQSEHDAYKERVKATLKKITRLPSKRGL